MSNDKSMNPLACVAEKTGYSYAHLRRLGHDGSIKMEKIKNRLFMDIDDARRVILERAVSSKRTDGRKIPEGSLTAHEVSRLSGYSPAHINKMVILGDVNAVAVGGRNYFDGGVIEYLRKRKIAMKKKRRDTMSEAVGNSAKNKGVGIGGNPASQMSINSQSPPSRDKNKKYEPVTKPPSGDSNMMAGSWRVKRPPPVPTRR